MYEIFRDSNMYVCNICRDGAIERTHHNRESVKSCSDGRPETGNSSRRPNKELTWGRDNALIIFQL